MGKPKSSAKKGKSKSKSRSNGPPQPAPTQPLKTSVWQPGEDQMEEDETLAYDPTAYQCLVAFSAEWPCLSFDMIKDDAGDRRETFPHTMYLAAGTQAASPGENGVIVLKLNGVSKGRHGEQAAKPKAEGMDDDESDDASSSCSDEEEPDAQALFSRTTTHYGCVNRLRTMPQQPHTLATSGDSGIVQIWDMGRHLQELQPLAPQQSVSDRAQPHASLRASPKHVHRHPQEGYALDWSRAAQGKLASGDTANQIMIHEPAESRWSMSGPYVGHTKSVEDIQWSPEEPTVFATCSSDRSICVWDTREKASCMLSVQNAHGGDVNVITWRPLVSHMIASGGDEGLLKVWDLRKFEQGKHLANFAHHRGAITAVEWSPFEAAMVCTGSEDGTVGIWDLSVERDPEEEAQMGQMQQSTPKDLPPQLMFIHAGQTDIKEVHWHPQIPGMVISTAREGFNAFKPSNV